VERREIAAATAYYEAAQKAPADGEPFSHVHVNALAELYLMQGMYSKALTLIASAEAPDTELPIDLIAKKGIALVHLLHFPQAAVRRCLGHIRVDSLLSRSGDQCRPWLTAQDALAPLRAQRADVAADLFIDVATAYIEESRFDVAVEWLHAAIENPEVRYREHGDRAMPYCVLTRLAEHVGATCTAQYDVPALWIRLGECYEQLQQTDRAIEVYEAGSCLSLLKDGLLSLCLKSRRW